MKKLVIASVIAILIAVQFFTIVAAAAPSVSTGSTYCGDTYVVQRGDWLARIARTCGTTIGNILVLNPWIYNPSLIYAGSVLRMSGSASTQPVYQQPPAPNYPQNYNTWYSGYYYPGYWWYPGYYNYGYNNYGYNNYGYNNYSYPRVSVSTTRINAGSTLTATIYGFPASANIDIRMEQQGHSYTSVYDGKTDSNGYASLTVTMPSSASQGQYWVVHVLTTELKNGVQAYSTLIYITG